MCWWDVKPYSITQSLEKDIMLGTMPGLRRQGGQRKQWTDDLTEWSNKSIPDIDTGHCPDGTGQVSNQHIKDSHSLKGSPTLGTRVYAP